MRVNSISRFKIISYGNIKVQIFFGKLFLQFGMLGWSYVGEICLVGQVCYYFIRVIFVYNRTICCDNKINYMYMYKFFINDSIL